MSDEATESNREKTPPRPEYGEYDPEIAAKIAAENAAELAQREHATSGPQAAVSHAADPLTPEPQPQPQNNERQSGVPHNLGVGVKTTDSQAAAANVAPVAATEQASPLAKPADKPVSQNIKTDRIFTIALLIISAFGMLNLGFSAMNIGSQMHLVADAIGIEDFEVAPVVTVIESIATLTVLSLFAISLLWSVHRLRTKKITFWVPLTAGALALLSLVIFSAIALAQSPELIANVTPETLESILQSLRTG